AEVKVSIPHLSAARVQVSGQAHGPTAEFLRFLQESPLRASAGRSTQGMSATGDGRLRLKLDLPLAELSATKVSGDYELTANQLTLTQALPPFEDARGKLTFSDASFAVPE